MVLNQQLINNVSFTETNRADYKKKGVHLIEKMFPLNTMHYLKSSVEKNFNTGDQPKGVIEKFDRFSNEFANRDDFFKELAHTITESLPAITGHELAVTQIAILELEVGKSKGFNWHFDEYSFCFVDTDSPAHTLWLPLNTIDVNKQRGGMVWVHQNDFDGRSRLKQWEFYQMADKSLKKPDAPYQKAQASQYLYNDWAGEFDMAMLDTMQQECSLELGDALLFNRHTWHKSQELLANGPLKKRTTIIFRLVSKDSKINNTLFNNTIERMKLEGSVPPKSFGDRLGNFKDGDLIRDAISAGVSF